MDYRDSYIDETGRKIIITSHKEVFEEIPKLQKGHKSMEYDEYYNDQGYWDNQKPQHNHCCKYPKNKRKMYEIDKVLGTGSGETFAEICIPLCPPAVEVLSCLATEDVIFDVLKAKKGKVFINGRLLKNIPYRPKRGMKHTIDQCCPDGDFSSTRCAVAEVPFIICMNVPGAVEGCKIVVLDYDVTAVNIPTYNCGCLINSITEKDCIWVKVKAVKPQIEPFPHKDCCR